MKKSSSSLSSLVDKIDWVALNPFYSRGSIGGHQIAVGFFPKSKKSPHEINMVRFKIGNKLIQQLKWKTGDKIYICNNPDDLMMFNLVKATTGWSLMKDGNSPHFKVSCQWTHNELQLNRMPSTIVQHEIYKDHLLFRVGKDASFDE